VAPTAGDWIRRFADHLGVAPPDDELVEALLGMAGVAAHASERTAAPISTWLAGVAGVTPDEALVAAKALAAELQSEAGAEGDTDAVDRPRGDDPGARPRP
jgi:hypothetical protein